MRIAVTGGRGFIGSVVTDMVEQYGHEPVVVDKADGRNIFRMYEIGRVDHVIHLAGVLGTAELFDIPLTAVDVNIRGTVNVLEYCREFGAGYTAVTLPPIFKSVYTITKMCADAFAEAWHLTYNVPVSFVRAYNVFGIGQKWGPGHPQKFLPTFATRAWRNEPLQIWGDGKQTMDVVSTRDLARMLVEATAYSDCELFEAGCGEEISVVDFAEYILHATGSTGGIEYLPMRKGETPSRIKASGLGWNLLGWQPTLNWDEVREAVMWYRDKV